MPFVRFAPFYVSCLVPRLVTRIVPRLTPSVPQCRPFVSLAVGSLVLPALLTGCAGVNTTGGTAAVPLATGNWQISSSDAAAAKLPVLSGELSGSSSAVSGLLHTQSAAACALPSVVLEVAGSADANGNLTLHGPLAGGSLSITGTLAPDGKSLTGAQYTVTGGSCAFLKAATATAQAFSPMQGDYNGNFADADGNIAAVTANLSQSTTPDANGNFTLAGTATVASNPCFPSSLTLSNTQVTGNTFTYTLSPGDAGANSVTASGTFSPDGSTLTVNSWSSSGTCGTDTGVVSTMTRQNH